MSCNPLNWRVLPTLRIVSCVFIPMGGVTLVLARSSSPWQTALGVYVLALGFHAWGMADGLLLAQRALDADRKAAASAETRA